LRNAERKGATASRVSDPRSLSLPRSCRLLQRAEYDAVYNEGGRKSSREFTVFLRPNRLELSRFGWSVKRAVGNAVRRNRVRRRLREILRVHRREIAPGWDVVIHPRSSVAEASFSAVTVELLKLLPRRESTAGAEE
jgi:ribonuclease P protein component